MAIAALIKYDQGASHPPAGQALIGVLAVLVTASNGDNQDVKVWEWEWRATPTGSAILPGIIASGQVPTVNFTPDVRGTYVLVLRVYDRFGNVREDVRCFSVLETNGRLIPNFDADASSMNYGGQRFGWHPYIEAHLKAIAASGGSTGADLDIQIGDGAGGFKVDTANFTYDPILHSIKSGIGNVVTGNHAGAFGQGNSVSADRGYAFGNGCTVDNLNAFATGNGCNAHGSGSFSGGAATDVTGATSFGFGLSTTVGGDYAAALGPSCTVGPYGYVHGDDLHTTAVGVFLSGITCTINTWGARGHGAGTLIPGTDIGEYWVAASCPAAPTTLVLGSSSEPTGNFVDGFTYAIEVDVVAKDTAGATCAREIHQILATVSGGVLQPFVDDSILSNPVINFVAAGWTLTIQPNAVDGTLQVIVDPGAGTIKAKAHVTWMAVPNA